MMNLVIFLFLSSTYVVTLFYFHFSMKKPLFYVWGMLGFVFLSLSSALMFKWYYPLTVTEANHSLALANLIQLRMQIVTGTVILIASPNEWVGLRIGIECSTFIEASAFIALGIFYPAIPSKKRFFTIIFGVTSLYLLNMFRILLIVWIVSLYGADAYIIAHGIVGRIFFFTVVVALYFGTFTNFTLHQIRHQLRPA